MTYTWIDKDDKEWTLPEISNAYLIAIINFCIDRNEKGVQVGGGFDIDSYWEDVDHNYYDDDLVILQRELQNRIKAGAYLVFDEVK